MFRCMGDGAVTLMLNRGHIYLLSLSSYTPACGGSMSVAVPERASNGLPGCEPHSVHLSEDILTGEELVSGLLLPLPSWPCFPPGFLSVCPGRRWSILLAGTPPASAVLSEDESIWCVLFIFFSSFVSLSVILFCLFIVSSAFLSAFSRRSNRPKMFLRCSLSRVHCFHHQIQEVS
jgi:hypothetical protein